jgi:hypothetical protein
MDRSLQTITFQYQSNKSWIKVALWSLWLICLVYMDFKKILVFDLNNPKSVLIFLAFHLWGFWSLQAIIWSLFGGLKIELNMYNLIITRNNGLFKTKSEFELNKIKEIEIQKNVYNGYSWTFGIFRIGGLDKEILAFESKGRWTKIGSKTANFKASIIKSEILKQKKLHPTK